MRDRQCALNHDAIESAPIVWPVINKPTTLSCVYHLSTSLWRNSLSPQCRNCSRDPDHAPFKEEFFRQGRTCYGKLMCQIRSLYRFTRYEAVNGGAKCRKWGGNFVEIFGIRKLQSLGVSCGVVCVILRFAILVELRLVTDTDGQSQTQAHG